MWIKLSLSKDVKDKLFTSYLIYSSDIIIKSSPSNLNILLLLKYFVSWFAICVKTTLPCFQEYFLLNWLNFFNLIIVTYLVSSIWLITRFKYDSLYITIIKLKSFNQFNKKYSWKQGNVVLTHIADQLKKHFGDSKIFRYEGDDFIVISDEYIKYDLKDLNLSEFDQNNIIQLESVEMLVNGKEDIYKFDEHIEK